VFIRGSYSCIVRKLLLTLGILIVCIIAVGTIWIFGGRQLSLLIDRFGTIQIASTQVNSIAYEGSGTGGVLIINGMSLSLSDKTPTLSPSFGSTKDNQFAVASGGRVFAFGLLTSGKESDDDQLATVLPKDDQTSFITRHSVLSWPTPFDFNFMTGESPIWKRHVYYELRCKKSSGATLEMLWRYEQNFYPGKGWGNGFMTREGSTGLIQIDISL
jgi:hypothetical protein